MGKKLYEETQEGGIYFKSKRKPWEVRVPNYVYDLWMPVLGVVDIGIYSVYCRLERENIVKAITLKDIARACRIGKSRLYDINERLEKCGFIQVAPPEGWQRLAHHTTEITVCDPPQEVPAWAIKEYVTEKIKGEYQPLSPWLVEDETQVEPPEVPNGTPEGPDQAADKVPSGTPNVETLGLKPLDVETDSFFENQQPADSSKTPCPKADPLLMELEHKSWQARQRTGNYAETVTAGGSDILADRLIEIYCLCLSEAQPRGQELTAARSTFERVLKRKKLSQDGTLTEQGLRVLLDPEGEWAFHFGNYAISGGHNRTRLFETHYGKVLARLLAGGDGYSEQFKKGPSHAKHSIPAARHAAPRRVATAEEAAPIIAAIYADDEVPDL